MGSKLNLEDVCPKSADSIKIKSRNIIYFKTFILLNFIIKSNNTPIPKIVDMVPKLLGKIYEKGNISLESL